MISNMVDVTKTKALDISYGQVLSAHEWQARDNSVRAHIFGIVKLYILIRDYKVNYMR